MGGYGGGGDTPDTPEPPKPEEPEMPAPDTAIKKEKAMRMSKPKSIK